ncbi:MAG: hypothetical protein Q9M50_07840 [Methylococcales bacterium]|nr:hypothetical protein [Methylococcales bacterium]
MTQLIPLIICNEKNDSHKKNTTLYSNHQEITALGFNQPPAIDDLISAILLNPNVLQAHLERISFCYQQDLTDHLLAALVDFLIIMKKNGLDLKRRMIEGTKFKLSAQDYNYLKNALDLPADEIKLLEGNAYSVLTKGFIGVSQLIKKSS